MPDVCLVSMPYQLLHLPSLGIGQLVSAAKEKGIDARAVYARFWFAEKIGLIKYNMVCYLLNTGSLLSEWTFSGAAFPDHQDGADDFLSMAISSYHEEKLIDIFLKKYHKHTNIKANFRDILWEIRTAADKFIGEAAERILEMKPLIVGCSSTFQQHCSSLALLKKIRELDSGVITIMGGGNCEGVMGQAALRCFPWIDFVMSGDADFNFPEFCALALSGKIAIKQDQLPYGVISREYASASEDNDVTAPVAMVDDMDKIPIPDYNDFFDELEKLPGKETITPELVIETSRGCWWGQKRKCNFCGLNGNKMRYRRKSADRIIHEISGMSQKYAQHRFFVADNIMDMGYFKELFPRLPETGPDQKQFFFEVKANLNEQHVKALKQAGVNRIQPGIESLNDNSLKLMNKGNSAARNVALLIYALENGVKVSWNYLIGLPGEEDAWNDETSRWLPLIFHLEPPIDICTIRFDRYSHYFYHQDLFGLDLSPYRTYSSIYPVPGSEIEKIAYFFEDNNKGDRGEGPGSRLLKACYKDWFKAFFNSSLGTCLPVDYRFDGRPRLLMRVEENKTIITDTRECAFRNELSLKGLEHKLHKYCRRPRPIAALRKSFNHHFGMDVKQGELDEVVNKLQEWKLLLIVGGKALSLATHETVHNKKSVAQIISSCEWFKKM